MHPGAPSLATTPEPSPPDDSLDVLLSVKLSIDNLVNKYTDKNNELMEVKKDLSEKDAEILKLKKEIAEKEARLADVEEKREEKRECFRMLQKEVGGLRDRLGRIGEIAEELD